MNKTKFRTNYNKKAKLFIILVFVSLVLQNCKDKEQDLYIFIKDGNGVEITGDTLPVSINSVHQTLIDVAFTGGSPSYLRQTDQGAIELLNKQETYELISHGINEDGTHFNKVVVTTYFTDTLMHIDALVRISVRVDTDMVESVFYKVTQ